VYSFAAVACECLFGRQGIPLGVIPALRKLLQRCRSPAPERPTFAEICEAFQKDSFAIFGVNPPEAAELTRYAESLRSSR
jgi:hypothetical protein